MNNNDNFQHLKHEESNAVVSFNNQTTYRVSKLMEQFNVFFRESVLNNLAERLQKINLGTPSYNKSHVWNIHGVDAEILEPKSGEWKKGKVRMRVILEFCPDEPEEIEDDFVQQVSSLDDICQTI